MLELRHLRLLDAIARTGSLTGAARELGYSQPAASQQIQALERHLRTPVVVRSRSGAVLTEAGTVLVRHGARILDLVARATAEVEAVADLRSGRVRLACFSSGAAMILPRALAEVSAAHPGISYTLTEAEPAAALAMVRAGEVDISIVYHYEPIGAAVDDAAGDETSVVLLREAVNVAVPVGHPTAGRDRIDLADLRAERWIAGCPDCRGHLVDACRAVGFEPDIAFETDDYAALQGLAAAGLGVALLPDMLLAAARSDPRLVVRPLDPAAVRVVRAVTTNGLLKVPAIGRTMRALVGASKEVDLAADVR